ncbi:hypothetical protein [Gordonia sp. FQ]|uniref:hypothetical protein n=1 Tax=Gordonia sp. FQ TaxID=3446634 RepID=UPI003F858177
MGAQQWVTLVVGLTAGFGVIATLWQRQRSEHHDRRERAEQQARAEWWKRWQWAIELALADEPSHQQVGMETLDSLTRSPLVTASEIDIVVAFTESRR